MFTREKFSNIIQLQYVPAEWTVQHLVQFLAQKGIFPGNDSDNSTDY